MKRQSCRAHWTETGCRHSAGRVLIDIVEQYHDWCETLKYTVWIEFCSTLAASGAASGEVVHPSGRKHHREVSSSVLHTLQTVCRLWAAGKQAVTIIQTWQYQCRCQRIQYVIVNIVIYLSRDSLPTCRRYCLTDSSANLNASCMTDDMMPFHIKAIFVCRKKNT